MAKTVRDHAATVAGLKVNVPDSDGAMAVAIRAGDRLGEYIVDTVSVTCMVHYVVNESQPNTVVRWDGSMDLPCLVALCWALTGVGFVSVVGFVSPAPSWRTVTRGNYEERGCSSFCRLSKTTGGGANNHTSHIKGYKETLTPPISER